MPPMMFARVVDAPPDPVLLARKLSDRPHLALLLGRGPRAEARCSFVACDPDAEISTLDPLAGAPGDDRAPATLAAFPEHIGFVPYEALRAIERPAWSPPEDRALPPLARTTWLRYPAVARVDHEDGTVLVAGRSRAAVRDLARALEGPPSAVAPPPNVEVVDDEPPSAHLARVERALELIRAGDLYQVNLARRIGLRVRGGAPDAPALVSLFERFARAAPSAFGALLSTPSGTLLSTSPELCLRADADDARRGFRALVTEPIKGTRPRGADAVDDDRQARALDADPKERAELAMIVDVERNDLHRVCVAGSVRVVAEPRVVTHRTIHHRVATIRGLVRPTATREEVLAATLPSGSVTGAPKIRAMEVIRELEAARRGLYTGALGFVAHDGSMTLAMAIRTAVLDVDAGQGEYLVGGGVVVDSSPARELEETRWKARQLHALLDR